jgi:putative transposase
MLTCPRLSTGRQERLQRLQRKLARARRDSNRRAAVNHSIARLKAREVDARKDWAEKLSTDLARRFDVIRVEDLRVHDMTRSAKGTVAEPGHNVHSKAGLNREILASGWGILVKRLEQKAPGRVEKIHPAYTSQRCSACGHVASGNRKSQAVFACTACGYAGQRGCERGSEHRRRACGDCAGRLAVGQACEPRTRTCTPIPIGPRVQSSSFSAGEDVKAGSRRRWKCRRPRGRWRR